MAFRPMDTESGEFRPLTPSDRSPPRISAVPDRAGPDLDDMEELQGLIREAREQGAAEARAEMEAELVQLREALDALGPTLEDLAAMRRRTLSQSAEDVADLVRLFASRVVHDALAHNPDALVRLVKEAVAQLPESEEVTIVVSPQAAETLTRVLEPKLKDRVVVDAEIQAGAVVRTRYASLDATLRTAEQGLETAVQEWLSEQWWVEGDLA
ncbi:MAG: flagellar assembly protein FliH [Myxococcales bacterium]|nr:flagellar assembly protein FliH [Myxococcales bacterium]